MKKFNFILLIDDDPIANFLTERLLSNLHLAEKIEIAQNGDQALDIITKECANGNDSPDLIFLDINMPVMSGMEFLEIFKISNFRNSEATNIAVLSTSTHTRDYQELMSHGITNILQKPLTESKMQKIIESLDHI